MKVYITQDILGCQLTTRKPYWNSNQKWWNYEVDWAPELLPDSEEALKAILNLDRWPEEGEMLIYDTVKEEGEIHVPR